jgi:hypothetical protein
MLAKIGLQTSKIGRRVEQKMDLCYGGSSCVYPEFSCSPAMW